MDSPPSTSSFYPRLRRRYVQWFDASHCLVTAALVLNAVTSAAPPSPFSLSSPLDPFTLTPWTMARPPRSNIMHPECTESLPTSC